MMRREVIAVAIRFKSKNVTQGEAVKIVKYDLDDPLVHPYTKLLAIQNVAEMETHNSITKDDLVASLRWIFARYDFPEED